MKEPNAEKSLNELQRYLHQSKAAENNSRLKQWSTQKKGKIWMDDQSKTERRSYNLNRSHESSVSREQSDQLRLKLLNNRSDLLAHSIQQAKSKIDRLVLQNKQLKQRLLKSQQQLDRQDSAYRTLLKKLQLKENTTGDQLKQLKNKLQQTEVQVHQLLNEKNNALTDLQKRQEQWMKSVKEKEKNINEQKKKLTLQLESKDKTIDRLRIEVKELRELLKESQDIVDQLNHNLHRTEQKVEIYNNELTQHKIELQKAHRNLNDLEELLTQKTDKQEENKSQKKAILELKKIKEETETMLNQLTTAHQEHSQEIETLRSNNKDKENTINALLKEKKILENKVEELNNNEKQLQARITRLEQESKTGLAQNSFINSQIKTVELQLTKVKLQTQYETASRAKKLSEYQKINELLNKKIQLLAQQNIQLSQKLMHLTDKLNYKQDQLFQLGQQIIKTKQTLMTLQAQNETLRQDREFLDKRVKQLQIKEDEVVQLRDQLEHKEKLFEELEHREEIREIELVNEIKSANHKKEEKEEQVNTLREQLLLTEQHNLQLIADIETLNYTLKNLETELECTKQETNTYHKNNLHFEEKMLALQRTENNSQCSIEELHQDNLSLKMIVKENEQAITALGKRYDLLLKGTVISLTRFHEILTQSRNIANQSIKHEKPQISSILNDSLRWVVQQRKKQQQLLSSLQNQLLQQRNRNSEHLKVIKIKSQMQEELQDELWKVKNHQQILLNKIANLETEIVNYQTQLVDKTNEVREGKLLLEKTQQQHRQLIKNKEENLAQQLRQINKLNQSAVAAQEKQKKEQEELLIKIELMQADHNHKIENANNKYNELENTLKNQKEMHKMMRIKANDLENTIAKQIKEKENTVAEIQKRTKELITVRVESDYRYKLILQKQEEISELKKNIDKLQKERDNLENRRKNLEEGNKTLVINRNELENTLKDKNNQLLEAQTQINELEIAKNRLNKTKDDLLNLKKNQEQNIRELNQLVKTLKESLLVSEQNNNQSQLQQQELAKEQQKQLNLLQRDNQHLQRTVENLKNKDQSSKQSEKQKTNSPNTQLTQSQPKNESQQNQIKNQRWPASNNKSLIAQSRSLSPRNKSTNSFEGNQKDLMLVVAELNRTMKTNENNRNKFVQLAAKKANTNLQAYLQTFGKELLTAISKLKITIMNRKTLVNENKQALLEDVKGVQTAADKLTKSLASDIY